MATAKEKLHQSLVDNGWRLDPRAKKNKDRYGRDLVQNPNVYLRPAAHGGEWRVELQWVNGGSIWYPKEGTRLMRVVVTHAPAGTDYETTPNGYDGTSYVSIGTLRNTENESRSYHRNSPLWDALKWNAEKGEAVGTLSQAVAHLVKNPDLAVWLGMVEEDRKRIAKAESDRKAAELRAAKARKLPITVGQEGHSWESTNEWSTLTRKLKSAAAAIEHADGTSNLPLLVADAQKALQAIWSALNEDARKNYSAYMTGEGTLSNL